LAGELLHPPVIGEAKHMQVLDLPVARDEQNPFEEHRSDSAALPCLLDAQGRLGFIRLRKQAQLGGTAQHAVDKKSVDDCAAERGGLGITLDELIRDGAAETVAPAARVEAQQMRTVKLGLAEPQPAHTTAYQALVHWVSCHSKFDQPRNRPRAHHALAGNCFSVARSCGEAYALSSSPAYVTDVMTECPAFVRDDEVAAVLARVACVIRGPAWALSLG